MPQPPVTERLLSTSGLVKRFNRRTVVHKVDLQVHSGEVVGLLGPNGAGKTTTFYLVVGFSRPDEGSVFLDGEDITDLPMYQRARKGISYLSQDASVFRKLTVEDNLLAVLETLEYSRRQRLERAEQLMAEFGITHIARTRGYALSGGERRRVEIARALVTTPAFILLDEPFAGIDPIAVTDIQGIIRALRDKGIGVLISDHNVRETLGVCDTAYIMNAGEILEQGNPQQISESKKAREIYLGERFRL
jgi:lipopolysaccharide export system ATP-binding protein